MRVRAALLHDVAVTDLHGASPIRTEGALGAAEDQVRMFVVRRGAWTLGGSSGQDACRISAGQVLVRHVGRPLHFRTDPHTTVKIVVLPSDLLGPLLAGRSITGSARSAEVRLLAAHTNMIQATLAGLGPAAAHAARDTLIELTRAVAQGWFDDAEPRLAPALVQAAKDLADRRLADPDLTSSMLARELNVSVRTLQRAFATAGDSVAAYIRRRRLDEVRLALAAPPRARMTISEIAAHWQFADSSHLARAFKKQFGMTPGEYARQAGPAR